MPGYLSPAQCVGYLAFVLGVTAFLQKHDRRLKSFVAAEAFAYAVHFALLGNSPASASSVVSGVRCLLALKTRSLWLLAAVIIINAGLGVLLVSRPLGWLPVVASCLGAFAIFRLRGLPMRITLFLCTLMWLANNILSGSIGGTALECVIAVANLSTMARRLVKKNIAPTGSGEASPVDELC